MQASVHQTQSCTCDTYPGCPAKMCLTTSKQRQFVDKHGADHLSLQTAASIANNRNCFNSKQQELLQQRQWLSRSMQQIMGNNLLTCLLEEGAVRMELHRRGMSWLASFFSDSSGL